MRSPLKSILRRLTRIRKPATNDQQRCISLKTRGTPRGDALIAYVIDPFLLKEGEAVSYGHTHHIESLMIAQTFLDLGYNVDVIDFRNRHFIPRKTYAFFVSARTFLSVIADRLNKDCIVIAHLDTSHFSFNNHAAYGRILALQRRRGISCPSIRVIEHNKAIERAHYGIVLGNETTMDTYRYSNTKLFPLSVPSPLTFPQLAREYASCRNHFLWFGSSGFVHKGLDLVLEAFCGMPDLHLHVCGPIHDDKDFCDAFRQELFHTANIHTIGWVDVSSPEFREIAKKTAALIYPSCAEGQAGSAVICLHAGLIPVLSRESGLDIGEFGFVLRDCTIDEIRRDSKNIASFSEHELERISKRAREYAQKVHTEEYYRAVYRDIIIEILNESKPTGAGTLAQP
jgi:hypothetical protein